jgi:PAS domain S-box-containing protein
MFKQLYLKFSPKGVLDPEDVNHWKEKILYTFIFMSVFLIFIMGATNFPYLIEKNYWAIIGTIIFSYIACLIIFFFPAIGYKKRASVVSFLVYSVGISIIFSVGPFLAPREYLLFFSILSAVLLGWPGAIVSILTNTLTLIGIGILIKIEFWKGFFVPADPIFFWFQISTDLIFINVCTTLSVSFFFQKIEKSDREAKASSELLLLEQANLINSKHKLEEEIKERKKTEAILGQSEEKYRTMIERSNDMIWTLDESGNFTFFNPQTENITGLRLDDWLGKSFIPLLMDEDLPMIMDIFQKNLKGESLHYELRFKKQTGEILTISVNTAPIWKDDAVDGIVSFGRDITDKKILEYQLQQSQKSEAIGFLAGGIAHDFNNILSGIFGYSQLAEMNINTPEKAKKNIQQVVKGAQRAAELVHQILTFSRQKETEKHPFKAYLQVKEALKLLRSSIPSTIEIQGQIDSRSMILADPTKIHQVVMNLCTNAYHAMMNRGGTLKVSLKDIEISEPKHLGGKDLAFGKYLVLNVSDTGHGMDHETLEKAFDPYFTTKKMGEGTGLGLAIVKAIVDEHNGFIEVNSTPGRGTRFYIYLPAIEKSPAPEQNTDETSSLFEGNETILLVDDEEAIRISCKKILEGYGYQVHAFENGGDAFKEFEKNPRQFDLVITDMTMPGMTGLELIQKIQEIRQDIPTLICSGFNGSIDEEKATQMGVSKYLMKPILKKDLASAIRELIDKKIP